MSPQIDRLFSKLRDAYRDYRFLTTSVHVHPQLYNELEHTAPRDMVEHRPSSDGTEFWLTTPWGELKIVPTETVPPEAMQLRRRDPRDRTPFTRRAPVR